MLLLKAGGYFRRADGAEQPAVFAALGVYLNVQPVHAGGKLLGALALHFKAVRIGLLFYIGGVDAACVAGKGQLARDEEIAGVAVVYFANVARLAGAFNVLLQNDFHIFINLLLVISLL